MEMPNDTNKSRYDKTYVLPYLKQYGACFIPGTNL